MIKFLAAVCVAAGLISGSAAVAQKAKDPKAEEILKKVSAKYKSAKSISAGFSILTLDQKNKKTDSQKGSIIVQGNKYRLTLQGQEVICDGKSAWTFIKETNEVQINEVDNSEEGLSPTNIFTIYERGFSSKYKGDTKIGNKNVQQIELVPDDANKSYFKILINIDKTEKMITSAKIFNKNGTHLTYSIDKLEMDKTYPESTFTFDKTKYPGAEIIDLR